ncbi:MAG TPA: pectate lyase [Verrucomicrobiae bacterium]|nr:pectate lyase [Verrucomicrobiae bacterium]
MNNRWITLCRTVGVAGMFVFAPGSFVSASVIGTNTPAESLTLERIATLPATQQPAWKNYLARSTQQLKTDHAVLETELREHGMKEPVIPPSGWSANSIPLQQSAEWYGSAEARRMADIIVSFQTPAGGWSKNLDLTDHPRAPGEYFAPNNRSRRLGDTDFDAPHDVHWNYVGTIDNDATTTELRYLAKVITVANPTNTAAYRAPFLRGIDYLLAAQYRNGGWPQVWPLEGGYHDTITYNDDAMINVLNLLRDVAGGKREFAFVPRATRAAASATVQRGIDCILATQIVVHGHRTVWCQQHDALTLQPAAGRNYEMPSQASAESASIMEFLMSEPDPSRRVVAAVHAAAAWFETTKIAGMAYQRDGDNGRHLVPSRNAQPLWARYYEIGTDRPIFGDRDKTIHDKLEEISEERRRGYAWYRNTPARALELYATWRTTHPYP